jgi:hypothetical protein
VVEELTATRNAAGSTRHADPAALPRFILLMRSLGRWSEYCFKLILLQLEHFYNLIIIIKIVGFVLWI